MYKPDQNANFVCMSNAGCLQVPFAIYNGAPISVGHYIVHSMIPDWIGNTIVAAFFLSGSYAFCYGTLGTRLEQRINVLRGKKPDDASGGGYNDSAHDAAQYDQQAPDGTVPLDAHMHKGRGENIPHHV